MGKKPTLGRNLEWHGNSIRVVVRVPPSMTKIIGSNHLRESLKTDSPRVAEMLKLPVIHRLKERIRNAAKGTGKDPLTEEALRWRQEQQNAETLPDAYSEIDTRTGELLKYGQIDQITDFIATRAEEIERTHGEDQASDFLGIAQGRVTPIGSLVDAWVQERRYVGRTESGQRLAIKRLLEWCATENISPHVERITRKIAGQYVGQLIRNGTNPKTGNKALGGIANYWTWLEERGHFAGKNPWRGQRIPNDKRKARAEDGGGDKRPFTDDEVRTLLSGIPAKEFRGAGRALPDMCVVAALTSGRIGELGNLRVRHYSQAEQTLTIPGEKTDNALRIIPLHAALRSLIEKRCEGKKPDDYLFHELPQQRSLERSRAAPASQSFTRARRELGVDDVLEGHRQSRIDFHSWRRWFIRKAVEALENGANGFTAWTIADVVGHSKEDGPLPMTMGRYPGRASIEAMRACVEAVSLPNPKNN